MVSIRSPNALLFQFLIVICFVIIGGHITESAVSGRLRVGMHDYVRALMNEHFPTGNPNPGKKYAWVCSHNY